MDRILKKLKWGKKQSLLLLVVFILSGCSDSTPSNTNEESGQFSVSSSIAEKDVEVKDTLLTMVSDIELTSAQKELFHHIKSRKTSEEVLIGQLVDCPQKFINDNNLLGLSVSDEKIYYAQREHLSKRETGSLSWTGTLKDKFGKVTLILKAESMTGTLWDWSDSILYKFEPLGDNLIAVIKVDDSEFGED
jgi:hypothetical protein